MTDREKHRFRHGDGGTSEMLAEHPHEAPANLRALAELFVTAERLSDWVVDHQEGAISAQGGIAPAVLEGRKAWALYLEKARDLGVTSRGRRELAAARRPPSRFAARTSSARGGRRSLIVQGRQSLRYFASELVGLELRPGQERLVDLIDSDFERLRTVVIRKGRRSGMTACAALVAA
jgi:hypothetical protein